MEGSPTPIADGGMPNSNYQTMKSSPNFLALSPDHAKRERENEIHKQARMNRSLSVGPGSDGASALNPVQLMERAMYCSLPFLAYMGMTRQASAIAQSASRASLASMAAAYGDDDAKILTQEVCPNEPGALCQKLTAHLATAAGIACGLMFLVGLNTAVLNSVELVVFPGHTILEWALAVAAFAVGGPFGSGVAGIISNRGGRCAAILCNIWLFLGGGALFALATSMYNIICARSIIGFASGFASVCVPIYLGELAPPGLRGTLGTLTQFSLVTGILASNILSFPLSTEGGWRYLFSTNCFVVLFQLSLMPFIRESPRWLLAKDSCSLEARLAIKDLRNLKDENEVSVEIESMLKAIKQQTLVGNTSAHSRGAVGSLLAERKLRPLLIGFIILHTAQQAQAYAVFRSLSGINAVFYYSTSFFSSITGGLSSWDPKVGTALMGAVNVVATYCAINCMETSGRVQLLMTSMGGMFIACFLITAALAHAVHSWAALVGVGAFVTFFELGLGPIPWLIAVELFDAKYVATAMSLASQFNWGMNFIVSLSFPYMEKSLGEWVFVPFGIILFLTCCYVALFLPETSGRTHEEILRIMETKNPKDENSKLVAKRKVVYSEA